MVTTLVQLHVIDWKDLGLQDFGAKGDYTKRQVREWRNVMLTEHPSQYC